MNNQYTCLLCQRPGKQLVSPECSPNKFALQEHLVQIHQVPWEYVLLGALRSDHADGGAEAMEWCLPLKHAQACGLPQACCLRLEQRTDAQATPFYLVATFPTREDCLLAEMEVIDQCKRHHPTSLAGGAGLLAETSMIVFVDLEEDHEPDHSHQQSIWSAIHRYRGECIALPAELVTAVADTLRAEVRARWTVQPEARWAEIDYTTGDTFYDVPTRSEIARDSNNL